jgi:hypothetical protein
MKLAEVIPWGRSFDEYRRMFALTDGDLAARVLGCGDGPAIREHLERAGFEADVVAVPYEFQKVRNHAGNRILRVRRRPA